MRKGLLLGVWLFIFLLPLQMAVHAQDTNAVAKPDTSIHTAASSLPDSVQPATIIPVVKKADTSLPFFNKLNGFLPVTGPFFYRTEEPFTPRSKDYAFYILGGMLLLLGIIRMTFSKYFADLIRLFTQTTIQQKSLREQLLQNRLASLLMNLFFCMSAGTFLFQMGAYKHWLPKDGIWWQQLLICIALIAGVYLVKYIGTAISGWLFGYKELAETYNFMVFLVNKVVGILLLPATIALALGVPNLQAICLVASLFGLGFLFLYRYVLAIPLLRQHVRIIPIHFFLYLCAFEIMPVLIVYKVMLSMI
ncbi:MAG TPA: DUF4271 domain-containing protein [Phnomibacter sp.]|nr:DUF4271 domain-containing protein [Phnomibacter sp.]